METTDRLCWVDLEALRAAEAARPTSTLADAAYALWQVIDLLEDARADRLDAEGRDACRWGLAELQQMVGLLTRRYVVAARRARAVLETPPPRQRAG